MSDTYIVDACSLIALLTNEKGSDVIKDLLQRATDFKIKVLMHKVNFLEVYYYIRRRYSEEIALKLIEDIRISPIKMNAEITNDILIIAGRLKSSYRISLADSIGLAETVINDGCFVTSDYHELEIVQEKEGINITWIRGRKGK